MNKIVVSPLEGVNVRHPESGEPIRINQTVERTPQIIRLLKDGDLLEVKAVSKKQPSKSEAK